MYHIIAVGYKNPMPICPERRPGCISVGNDINTGKKLFEGYCEGAKTQDSRLYGYKLELWDGDQLLRETLPAAGAEPAKQQPGGTIQLKKRKRRSRHMITFDPI